MKQVQEGRSDWEAARGGRKEQVGLELSLLHSFTPRGHLARRPLPPTSHVSSTTGPAPQLRASWRAKKRNRNSSGTFPRARDPENEVCSELGARESTFALPLLQARCLGRCGKLPGGESRLPQDPGLVFQTCSGCGRNMLPPASPRLLSRSAA